MKKSIFVAVAILTLAFLNIARSDQATITLEWDVVQFAGAYQVQHRINGGQWILSEVGETRALLYADLSPGSIVEARVKGCYLRGTECPEGTYSEVVSDTYTPKLEAPRNVSMSTIFSGIMTMP